MNCVWFELKLAPLKWIWIVPIWLVDQHGLMCLVLVNKKKNQTVFHFFSHSGLMHNPVRVLEVHSFFFLTNLTRYFSDEIKPILGKLSPSTMMLLKEIHLRCMSRPKRKGWRRWNWKWQTEIKWILSLEKREKQRERGREAEDQHIARDN